MLEVAAAAVQVATGTLLVVTGAGQVVVVQAFEEVADDTVQAATGTLVVVTGAGQVVVVQLFEDVADDAVQVATGILVVLFVPQVVAVQALLLLAVTGVQVCIPVGPVVIGTGQVVVVQLFEEVAEEAVHEATGTLLVLLVLQVVVV